MTPLVETKSTTATRPNLVFCVGRGSGVEPVRDAIVRGGNVAWIEERDFDAVDGDASSFPLLTYDPTYTTDPDVGDAFEAIARRHAGRVGRIGWTPGYMMELPHVAWHVARFLPEAKLLFCLRDPIDAAWHRFQTQRDQMPPTFEAAVDACEERMRELSRYEKRGDWSNFISAPDPVATLLQGGVYAPTLARSLRLFPRESVHVFTYEGFQDRPAEHEAEIRRFLGLGATEGSAGTTPDASLNADEITAGVRQRLVEFYAPFNRQLVELMDWSEAPWR